MRESIVTSSEITLVSDGGLRHRQPELIASGAPGSSSESNQRAICGAERPRADKPPRHDHHGDNMAPDATYMTFAEFVERRFIPEHVVQRKSAGRSHFYAILKHILTPSRVDQAFHISVHAMPVRLKEIESWPYMDSLLMSEVTSERIQRLLYAALDRGYSVQTVTHIRNVIRTILNHAALESQTNPVSAVVLPSMVHKEGQALSSIALRQTIQLLPYPARELALFILLTNMKVAEICGLQWKHVNLSCIPARLDRGWIPPMMIAIRMQSYRTEFGSAPESRKRNIAIPELLAHVLQQLQKRVWFTGPDDFVLASRSGTAISQDNLARRKLKSVGKALGISWLTWNSFHLTGTKLTSKNKHFWNELERVVRSGGAPPGRAMTERAQSDQSATHPFIDQRDDPEFHATLRKRARGF